MEDRPLRQSAIHRMPTPVEPLDPSLRNRTLIDVRPAGRYRRSHVAGSINFPDTDTRALVAALSKRGPAVLVCDDGRSSANIVRMLAVCGSTEVTYLNGGLKAYAEDGLPLVTATRTSRLLLAGAVLLLTATALLLA